MISYAREKKAAAVAEQSPILESGEQQYNGGLDDFDGVFDV